MGAMAQRMVARQFERCQDAEFHVLAEFGLAD